MNTLLAGQADLMFTSQGDTAQTVRKTGVNEASIVLNGASVIIFNTTKAPFDGRPRPQGRHLEPRRQQVR